MAYTPEQKKAAFALIGPDAHRVRAAAQLAGLDPIPALALKFGLSTEHAERLNTMCINGEI
jgi:hypothetical protein